MLMLSFSLLGDLFCIAVIVILSIHNSQDFGYEHIQIMKKQSVIQQPIAYFKADNGTNSLHKFFYWEGMYEVQKCWCEKYDEENNCILPECKNVVDDVKGFNLTMWRNTTFIYQNSINYNYLTLLKHAKPPNVQCDKGYKQCGILDSFNQKLCLWENETCPLNQIELSNSSTPSDIFTNKDAVKTTLLNDNKTYLHTSNAERNSLVITEIAIGPESFCMNYTERKLGPPYYEYEPSSTNGACTEYMGYQTDFRYLSIDKQSKFDVYNENGIITKIQGFLTYSNYPYPEEEHKKYTLHLYKLNYIGFNLTCLSNQELNEESMNVVRKYEYATYILNTVATSFLFI